MENSSKIVKKLFKKALTLFRNGSIIEVVPEHKIYSGSQKQKLAKITPHSTKDRFSSQLPVFFLFGVLWVFGGLDVAARMAAFLWMGCELWFVRVCYVRRVRAAADADCVMFCGRVARD